MENSVKITFNDKDYIVSKEWYELIQRFSPDVPLNRLFDVYFVKCDNKSLRQKTGHVMLFNGLIESSVKGYYIIPGFTRYAISKDGYVIRRDSGRASKRNMNPFGYYEVGVYDEDKSRYRDVCLHILLARTFIPNNDWSKPIINHIDGDKSNNRLSNLEWCDSDENARHASEVLKVSKERVPVKVRDVRDMSVRVYRSKSEAFRDLGMGYVLPIKEGKSLVFHNRYEMRLESSEGWKYNSLEEISDMNNMNYNEVGPYEALNVRTGEVITASNIKRLSYKLDISTTSIRKNIAKGLVTRDWFIRNKSFKPFPTSFKDVTYFPPKAVIGSSEGQEYEFPSLRKAYKTARIDRQKVLDMIDDGSTFKGWSFRWKLSPAEATRCKNKTL